MPTDANYQGQNLLLIVGCPRSGTTWLQRLLAAHPKVRTGQESDLFDTYVGPQLRAWRTGLDAASSGRGGLGLGCYLDEDAFRRTLRTYALSLIEPMVGRLAPDEVFVEKTPGHILWIPEILDLFPQTRFIHVVRDARDVVASLLAASQSWGSGWAPRRAGSAAATWRSHVEAGLAAARQLPGTQLIEVRYEDLHANPIGQLRRAADLLGLEWPEDEIRTAVEVNRADVARHGGGTEIPVGGEFAARTGGVVREPQGFVRKAQPQAWRSDLTAFQKLRTWMVARHTMAAAGYPWPLPW